MYVVLSFLLFKDLLFLKIYIYFNLVIKFIEEKKFKNRIYVYLDEFIEIKYEYIDLKGFSFKKKLI